MSYRGRHRRRRPLTLVAPPVVVATAASLSLAGAQARLPDPGASRPVADITTSGLSLPVEPFSATPYQWRIVAADAATPAHRRHHKRQAASPGRITLPMHLDVTASSIPRRVLEAYVNATAIADTTDPTCHLQWQTLAAIGFIESDHARSGGSENPHWDGVANPPILGPVLDGKDGVGAIPDTDGGRLDGNKQWDRAVGPMQFIPSTWARWAADGNHDGIEDPQDIDDATLAAANYLCASGPDLDTRKPRIRAIYSYNHSWRYVAAVLTVAAHYAGIDPAKLGIKGLPKDAGEKKPHRKHRHHRRSSRHGGRPAPTSTPTAAVSPTMSPTKTPTTSPTSSPIATPTASPSATPSGSASPTPSDTATPQETP